MAFLLKNNYFPKQNKFGEESGLAVFLIAATINKRRLGFSYILLIQSVVISQVM